MTTSIPNKQEENTIKVVNDEGNEKMLVLAPQKQESIDDLSKEFYELIETINEKKKIAHISYTKQRLEKAIELCDRILYKKQSEKSMLGF